METIGSILWKQAVADDCMVGGMGRMPYGSYYRLYSRYQEPVRRGLVVVRYRNEDCHTVRERDSCGNECCLTICQIIRIQNMHKTFIGNQIET